MKILVSIITFFAFTNIAMACCGGGGIPNFPSFPNDSKGKKASVDFEKAFTEKSQYKQLTDGGVLISDASTGCEVVAVSNGTSLAPVSAIDCSANKEPKTFEI